MSQSRNPGMLRLIGAFRLLKGVLLIAVAFGALKFLHRDLGEQIHRWFDHWQVDPDNHYVQALISKASGLDPHNLVLMSIASIFYSGLFLTEGVGLWLRKHWAEYLTLIATSSFIPLEIYHLAKHFTPIKVVVIAINAAIVIYLAVRLKKERHQAA